MKRFISLLFILLLACTPHQEAELTAGNSPAYASSNYPTKWTKGFPLQLNISNDFDAEEVDAIELAANNWEESLDNKVNFFNIQNTNFTQKNTLNQYNDGFYGIYKVHDWPDELPLTALAVTQINGTQFSSYIRIDQADILVNFDYYSFGTDNRWGYDLSTVVLHELGHFLGMYHDKSSADLSVMYPTIGRLSVNREPKENDITNLGQKYSIFTQRNISPGSAINNYEQGKKISLRLELYPNKEILTINGQSFNIDHH